MAIYRNGKKVESIYRNGKAVTGVYRNGVKLWDKGNPETIHGLRLDLGDVENKLYLQYALSVTTGNQRDYYVDVNLGDNVLRLAGDMMGRIKGSLTNGILTWSGVTITDEKLWVGKEIEIAIKADSRTKYADSVTYPALHKATYVFNDEHLTPDSKLHTAIRVISSNGRYMTMVLKLKDENALSYSGLPTEQNYRFKDGQNYYSAVKEWLVPSASYDLALDGANVQMAVEYHNLQERYSNESWIETPKVDKTIKVRVKGIIK